MRLYLLFTSQHFLDGDEAVVGLMAKHILERGEHPLFWYGIHYNGAGSWEAHLGALIFKIAGYSDYSLKFAAVLISMALLVFLYLWAKENFGVVAGLLTSFFYVFSVSFIQWNLKLRGHLTLILCLTILLWLYYRFLFQAKREKIFSLLVGLFSGLSVWCLESSVVMIFVFLLFWFILDKRFFLRRNFFAMAMMFIIGAFPVIYENLAYNFANIKHLIGSSIDIVETPSFTAKLIDFFTYAFPALFHWNIIHNYPEYLPWYVWIGYAFLIISSAYFISILIVPLKKWFGLLVNKQPNDISVLQEGRILFIAVYLLMFLSAFIFSKFSLMSPRYLLTLAPGIFAIMALFTGRIIISKKYILRILAVCMLAGWAYMGIVNTYNVSRDFTMIDGFTKSQGPDIELLIAEMETKNIKFAIADKFIKNRVIFYSKEQIIVSRYRNLNGSVFGFPPYSLYPEYERMLDNSGEQPAYIFGDQPSIQVSFEDFLMTHNITFDLRRIGSYALYYNFSSHFNSGDFIVFLRYNGFTYSELLKWL
ncbi:glycosyltransferase family 39 protein [bacterium]|nr:glycosyltransferase family 39 protein [bacterium]